MLGLVNDNRALMEAALNANLNWYLINFIHGSWRFWGHNKFDEPAYPCQNGNLEHACFLQEIQWNTESVALIEMLLNLFNNGILENNLSKNI